MSLSPQVRAQMEAQEILQRAREPRRDTEAFTDLHARAEWLKHRDDALSMKESIDSASKPRKRKAAVVTALLVACVFVAIAVVVWRLQ